jgi:hypothetical protein
MNLLLEPRIFDWTDPATQPGSDFQARILCSGRRCNGEQVHFRIYSRARPPAAGNIDAKKELSKNI